MPAPFLTLPTLDRTLLPRSPLELVVCQVRTEDNPEVTSSRTVLAIHEALGGAKGPYPKIEPMQIGRVQLAMGAISGAQTLPVQTGSRLVSDDGKWSVALMPDFFALETSQYRTWDDDFGIRFGRLVDAVAKHARPVTERRLGLRYVDRLASPVVKSPEKWKEYIVPELLGIVGHETVGPAVTGVQQQVDLNLGDGTRCILRHGLYQEPDGKFPYVMDFDVYREHFLPFDPAGIKAAADQLSLWALRLFQISVTSKLLEHLKSAAE